MLFNQIQNLLFAEEDGSAAPFDQLCQALIESSLAGIYVARSGTILYANSRFVSLLGHESLESLQRERHYPELTESRPLNPFRLSIARAGQSRLRLEIQSSQLEHRNEIVTVGSCVDVTHLEIQESLLQERARVARKIADTRLHQREILEKLVVLLRGTLDAPLSLASFALVLTEELCDWCTLEMREDDGTVHRLAGAHFDPKRRALLETLRREYPTGPCYRQEFEEALRSGRPAFNNEVSYERVRLSTHDENHARLVAELGIRSLLALPLLVEGKVIGTLTLVCAHEQARYNQADFSFFQEIAALAAGVVSDARSFSRVKNEVKLRDQFLSIASHELKTPLTSLQSLIQLLLLRTRRGEPLDSAANIHMLESAENQSKRMIRLINDLLDMSRMTAGRLILKCEPCDLAELLKEAVERIEAQAKAAGCEVTIQGPSCLKGIWDRSRIEEVIANLLSNALKYGKGRPIRIQLEARRRADGESAAWVSVRDHGMGIAPQDQARIFDVFERAAHTHDHLGHGLGLYIVRQILDAHRGSIQVQSIAGQGSTFSFELPRN
jgi:signal transduction histidine kinase/PAS domain-containing protein